MTGRRVDHTPIPLGPDLPGAACKGKSPAFDWMTDGEEQRRAREREVAA